MISRVSQKKMLKIVPQDSTIVPFSVHVQKVKVVFGFFFQFSPFAKGSKRYMLSTGTDATVCFWQWDVNNINFR